MLIVLMYSRTALYKNRPFTINDGVTMRSYELVSFAKLSNNTGSTEAPHTRSIEPKLPSDRWIELIEDRHKHRQTWIILHSDTKNLLN